ncbi:MAG: hypothetical protein IJ463_08385 [Bacilli bacterium]|nr:hypothetical protein [Bacilli bacterium]
MSMIVIGNNGANVFDPETLKIMSNIVLSYAYDAVEKYPEPKREDYQTEEEFKKAYNDYLMLLVEYVSKIKHDVFSDVLDTYNDTISFEIKMKDSIDKLNNRINGDIAYCNRNIRHGIISTVICSLLFPVNMIPVFLGLGGARYLLNKAKIKRCMTVSQEQKAMLQQFHEDKEAIYQFQDSLRTDYHSRKGELETLRRMVLDGKVNSDNKQNFMDRLRQLINPKTYQMEKFDERFYASSVFLLDLMGKDVLIDSPKQMIKK